MQTLLNLLAAIAMLVWGTHIVRTGVLRVFGANLRQLLRRSVGTRTGAFLAGIGVTGLLQSSTATALLTSSFVAQNLIGTAAALAVMLGADVGTALMVQVFSLDLSWLAPLLIVVGVIVFLSKRNERAGQIGRIALGLGVMIMALQLIVAATAPLTQAAGVKVLFAQLSGDAMLDLLIGALLAVLCYSSLAVVLLTAALAASHVIAIPVALAVVLGANLGSGLLAVLTTLNSDPVARRVPLGNLVAKAVGCALALLLLPFALRDPYRLSHFQSEQYRTAWPEAGEYLDTLEKAGMMGQWELGIPGAREYMEAIDNACTAAYAGTDPKAALDEAAAKWDAVTERLGVENQKKAFEQWLKNPWNRPGPTVEVPAQ